MKKFFLVLSLTLFFLPAGAQERADERPNILICIADDASYPFMGAYGCDWVKTPSFDRVAQQGILFTNAYTPNAKCAPSRASILTGRNSWQLEEAGNHNAYFPAKFKTYAETLRENGYHVGFTAKGWSPGNPGKIDGKPRRLTGIPYSQLKTDPPARGMSKVDYAANFEAFLNDVQDGQPFCFWYGATEPHRPYEFGAGSRKGKKNPGDIDSVPGFWPDNDTVRTDMTDYAFELEYFDKHLGVMLDILEKKGALENTLVVVTADNGMPFPRVKGQEYEYSNHMPMAAMWQNGIGGGGRIVEDLVSFIDLAPTFLQVAHVDAERSGMAPLQGKSLFEIFAGDKSGQVDPARDYVLIGKERHDVGRPYDQGYPIRGIVSGGYLYLYNFEPSRWPAGNPETGYLEVDGSPTKTYILNNRLTPGQELFWKMGFAKRGPEELYRIKTDPECLVNLAENKEYESVKTAMKDRLFNKLKEQGDPRMFGRGHVFDEYPHAGKPGFYEKFMSGEKIITPWINDSDIEK